MVIVGGLLHLHHDGKIGPENTDLMLRFITFFTLSVVASTSISGTSLYYSAINDTIKYGLHWISGVHNHLRQLTSFRCGALCSRRPQEQTQQHPCQRHLHHNGSELTLVPPKQIITQKLWVTESTIYPPQPGGAHSQSVNHNH